MRPLPIPPELFEQPDQRSLSHLPGAAGGHPQPSPDPFDQPGPLQRPFDLLERPDVTDRILPERPAQPVLVDVLQRRPGVLAPQRPVQLLVVGQPLQRVHGGPHGHGVLAAGQRGLVPRQLREHLPQRPGQLRDLEHQLRALLGRHRRQQPRQRGHPPGHPLKQLVQRPRPLGEEVAEPLHEPFEVLLGVRALLPVGDHAVQLRQHVLEPGHVLGRQRP